MTLKVYEDIPQAGRTLRRPSHRFFLRTQPYQIQPFMIAPVLPGETLKNFTMQSRVVTQPIDNALIGWWQEYFMFYVKLRDLDARDQITETMLTPGLTFNPGPGIDKPTVNDPDANPLLYTNANSPQWTAHCLKRVVEEYFRDEGETWLSQRVGNLPQAAINQDHWVDSVKTAASVPANSGDENLPEEQGVLPAHMVGWEAQYAQWQHMTALEVTKATFEDWLRQFGIRAPKEVKETHTPELLRFVRDWKYPSNTVDPVSGAPSSAVSWAIAERGDKDRFFNEPGFIFGVSVTRPKVYLGGQSEAGVNMLRDAFAFLPALLDPEPYTSLKKFGQADGPLRNLGDATGYWVDLRDLFIHGDQFLNILPGDAAAGWDAMHAVNLPRAGGPAAIGEKRYATAADISSLFKDTTKPFIHQDGVCSLNIATRLRDKT